MKKELKIGNVFDNKIILFCDGKMLFYYNRNTEKYEWEKTNVDKLLKILFSDLEEIPFNEISKELEKTKKEKNVVVWNPRSRRHEIVKK